MYAFGSFSAAAATALTLAATGFGVSAQPAVMRFAMLARSDQAEDVTLPARRADDRESSRLKREQVKVLIDRLRQNDPTAFSDLKEIGEPAVPYLAKLVWDENEKIVDQSFVLLAEVGEKAAGAVPELLKVLRHADPGMRSGALRTLASIRDKRAIPAAINVMKTDPEKLVRSTAAESLTGYRDEKDKILRALGELLLNKDSYLQGTAVFALSEIRPEGATLVVGVLRDKAKAPSLRGMATIALWQNCPEAGGAVEALASALADPDNDLRQSAASALGHLGPPAKPAIEALKGYIKRGGVDDRIWGAQALFQIDPNDFLSVSVLRDALGHKNSEVRALALGAMDQMGARAGSALARLIELAADPDPTIRLRVANVLGGIGRSAQEALPALKRMLTDDNKSVRGAAREAIKRIERSPPP
jgi:HEAT repeat protein